MNVKIIDELSGSYQISKGVSVNELKTIAENPKASQIQFDSPLNDIEIDYLEEFVFSKRFDIRLRIYAYYSQECDLSFLSRIPSLRKISADCLTWVNVKGIETITKLKNLESLCIGIYLLENFDFLENINPSIKELSLEKTKSKKPKLNFIGRFQKLEYLYLEGQSKDIEEIKKLKNLKRIVLRSITTKNLDFLIDLDDLWSVDIKLGGIQNFSALENLPNLKNLELWLIRELSDLSFISTLITLQRLFLQDLRNVSKFPDVKNLLSLRRIVIENLKRLKDFTSLKFAPALEEFILIGSNHEFESLIPILENSNLKSIGGYFGSLNKNSEFIKFSSKYRKDKYESVKFIYK